MAEAQGIPVPIDELMGRLKTRGFEQGFSATPLREFKGKLDSITGSMEKRGQAETAKERLYIYYNFSKLEVISSVTPYTDPIAQIDMPHSDREQSQMGVFGKSVDKVINTDIPEDADPADIKGQDYLVGKIVHMKFTGGHMMWDGNKRDEAHPKGQEVPRDCWEAIEVEDDPDDAPPVMAKPVVKPLIKAPLPKAQAPAGKTTTKSAGSNGGMQRALDLLDGKTEAQFYKDFFADPVLKADSLLVTKVTSRQLISSLEASEQVVKDQDTGIYHKV